MLNREEALRPPDGSVIMRHTDHRHLIDRGRKAGLGTGDLYSALAAHQAEVNGQLPPGRTDGNGFVSAYDRRGQRVYRPAGAPERS